VLRRALNITRWPVAVVIVFAGAMATGLAFASVNLFQRGVANLFLIQRHGILALREGAALQLAGLVVSGLVALFCYLGFKFSEVELSIRYRRWCDRRPTGDPPPPDGAD